MTTITATPGKVANGFDYVTGFDVATALDGVASFEFLTDEAGGYAGVLVRPKTARNAVIETQTYSVYGYGDPVSAFKHSSLKRVHVARAYGDHAVREYATPGMLAKFKAVNDFYAGLFAQFNGNN